MFNPWLLVTTTLADAPTSNQLHCAGHVADLGGVHRAVPRFPSTLRNKMPASGSTQVCDCVILIKGHDWHWSTAAYLASSMIALTTSISCYSMYSQHAGKTLLHPDVKPKWLKKAQATPAVVPCSWLSWLESMVPNQLGWVTNLWLVTPPWRKSLKHIQKTTCWVAITVYLQKHQHVCRFIWMCAWMEGMKSKRMKHGWMDWCAHAHLSVCLSVCQSVCISCSGMDMKWHVMTCT